MNRFLEIICAFALLLILGAPSCVNEEERKIYQEARLQREIDRIYSEYESMGISDSLLLIYQSEARRKLMDMADYFQVLSDSSLDTSIRRKAAEILQLQFITEDVLLSLDPENIEISLKLLINNPLTGAVSMPSYRFDSIRIKQGLTKWKKDSYKGIFLFQEFSAEPREPCNSSLRSIDFYLIKEKKIFGTDTLNIWDIRFGDMRCVLSKSHE